MTTPRLMAGEVQLHEGVPTSDFEHGNPASHRIPYRRHEPTPVASVAASTIKDHILPTPQDAHSQPTKGIPRPQSPLPFDVQEIVAIVRSKWLLPLIGGAIGLAAALAYFAMVPDLYRSSARLLIDKSVNQYLQANTIIREPMIEDVGSQIYIISSDSVLVPVVKSLKLTEDPEFVGLPKTPEDANSPKAQIKAFVKKAIGWGSPATGSEMPPERIAVQSLLERLSIYREDVPTVINVTFASLDPRKAAEIANAISDTYIAASRDAKINSTRTAGKLLELRLMEIRTQLFNVEQKLATYKEQNFLGSSDTSVLASDQLAHLQRQLTEARIAAAVAKARLTAAEQAIAEGAPDRIARDNEIIIKARVQYLELASQVRDLEVRLGPSHIKVAKLRKQMDELQSAIRSEEVRISASYKNDYEAAQARVAELATTKTAMVEQLDDKSNARSKLRELETSAETLRGLYNHSLQKYSELPESVRVEDARIIARASPHAHKSTKKRTAILGGGVLLGLSLGMAMVLAREFFTGRFRKAAQVRSATDAPCSVLPLLPVPPATGPCGPNGCLVSAEEWVIHKPHTRFADAVHNIRACIETANHINGDKVIGIASCVSGEGKTTVASNLAASLVSDGMAKRVLLIDCDLHMRSLTATLAPDAEKGLIEALRDPAFLGSHVFKKETSGVHILPCVLENRLRDAAKVLGSSEMNRLLSFARADYDFILIELPPVMSVVDVKMIERFIDGFILVIDWGRTKRRLVDEAFAEMDFLHDRLVCTVLNKVDPSALKTIEAYKDPKSNDYYMG